MKLLAICLLALALIFRAAPLCAAPITTDAVAAMTECDDASGHHGDEQGEKREGAAFACHACVSPPVASADFIHPILPIAMPSVEAVTRFAGTMAEPPTPPPQLGSTNHL